MGMHLREKICFAVIVPPAHQKFLAQKAAQSRFQQVFFSITPIRARALRPFPANIFLLAKTGPYGKIKRQTFV